MNDDVFSLVLGLQGTPEEKAEQELLEKKRIELCLRVEEMTKQEGWKDLLEEIEAFEKLHSLAPQFYSDDAKLAHIHTGALYAMKFIRDWAVNCKSFIEEYEEKHKTTPEGSGT